MLSKTKKIEKGLKKVNQEAKVVKQLINPTLTQEKKKNLTKGIYSQKIHQRVWAWIDSQ